MIQKGKVYIMGVGPGDYKLITLKAVECIAKADVIVYDRLVSSKILGFARKDAELVYVGKMPDHHAVPQDGINAILVEKALEGKTVARVKGGDPFVFGRGGEEAESLYERGIEFEIVPGVTSAIAVPAYAGIPVTHRDFCSSFHIVTGHERPEKTDSAINFEGLAKIDGTLIFLMGVKNLQEICTNLMKYGKSETTPAAVVERGTTMDQRVVTGTLRDIAAKVSESGVKSPAVTIIGEVAGLRERLHWFPKGKLSGKKVVVTRSREQASKLVDKIEDLGGEAVEFPAIKIEKPEDYTQFDAALRNLGSFQWLVFTSVNGVKAFFERMLALHVDIRNLFGIKLCAVGDATAGELQKTGLNVDYIPDKYTTEELLKGLLERAKSGDGVLLARADIANPDLSQGLKDHGYAVEDLVVYKTATSDESRDEVVQRLKEGKIDFITFTSSSTVKNFLTILGVENIPLLSGVKMAAIGPVTAKTAEELGLKIDMVADTYTIDGLIEKMVESVGCRV